MEKLLALAKTAKMGNPLETTTQVGPVTTKPQYEKVLGYLAGIDAGGQGRAVRGGDRPRRGDCRAGAEPRAVDLSQVRH